MSDQFFALLLVVIGMLMFGYCIASGYGGDDDDSGGAPV